MRIAVLAKAPLPGRAKTRLIPALGEKGAAALAAEMLDETVRQALATGLAVELHGDPDPAGWYRGPALRLVSQGAGDLGARLARVAGGELPVLLIGADCPALDAGRLAAAAEALESHDAVIHPAEDGGYALLGLRRFDPSLFRGIAWSTPSVAAATIGRIRGLGWSLAILDTLRDIDGPGDLAAVRKAREAGFPLSRE